MKNEKREKNKKKKKREKKYRAYSNAQELEYKDQTFLAVSVLSNTRKAGDTKERKFLQERMNNVWSIIIFPLKSLLIIEIYSIRRYSL